MVRARVLFTALVALTFLATVTSAVQAQQRGRSLSGRSSLMGLLGNEQVQTEMKLTDEQKTKIQAAVQKSMAEMREKFGELRDMEDRAKRTEKMTELVDEMDGKLRGQLREMGLEREQMMRLFQIRMQVRSVLENLATERLAARLKVTDEQKEKLAAITKEYGEKRTELMASLRDADQEERGAAMEKFRELRTATDKKATDVLTDEQKKSFEEMKGKIIELRTQRRRRQAI